MTDDRLVERVAGRLAHGISRDSLARGLAGELVRSSRVLAGDDAALAETIVGERTARLLAELRENEKRRVSARRTARR